ncbi:hypothetical protein [Mucilaginibacter myungsuensis]|uniref:Uncharacterized protein n=1 Tax=Mucilaginibacter myungsuensis TaxID=649104 RepID=A0A929KY87_9SPHI|nr:hypothetical protein [Mucilaginibacter myungsuensis]MBE9661094.1 hypothetical protein [Mucilaginibacter myungsuensis]MDN3597238.1 hypothetical protein [Mucilaginibacter myungsuensis]
MQISIDSAGFFTLTGADNPYRTRGPLKGQLTKAELDSLNDILHHSQLRKMHDWKQLNIAHDTPVYSIYITYNKEFLSIYTARPPSNMMALINFLLPFYQRLPVKVKVKTVTLTN